MRLGQQGLLSPMACGGSFAGIFMRQCQTLCQPIVYELRLYRRHIDVPPASIRRGARRRHCNVLVCQASFEAPSTSPEKRSPRGCYESRTGLVDPEEASAASLRNLYEL